MASDVLATGEADVLTAMILTSLSRDISTHAPKSQGMSYVETILQMQLFGVRRVDIFEDAARYSLKLFTNGYMCCTGFNGQCLYGHVLFCVVSIDRDSIVAEHKLRCVLFIEGKRTAYSVINDNGIFQKMKSWGNVFLCDCFK